MPNSNGATCIDAPQGPLPSAVIEMAFVDPGYSKGRKGLSVRNPWGGFLVKDLDFNFKFRTFWADLSLLCVAICRFVWAEMPGKKEEIPGQTQHD